MFNMGGDHARELIFGVRLTGRGNDVVSVLSGKLEEGALVQEGAEFLGFRAETQLQQVWLEMLGKVNPLADPTFHPPSGMLFQLPSLCNR